MFGTLLEIGGERDLKRGEAVPPVEADRALVRTRRFLS
jgi:hypothetical protein